MTNIKGTVTRNRLAHFRAVVIYVLSHFVVVAHAGELHDAHSPADHCAICCVAFSDDDVDTPPSFLLTDAARSSPQIDLIRNHSVYTQINTNGIKVRAPPRC